MKTFIRFFSMLALVGGIAVTGALAQNPCDDVDTPTAQYTKFTEQWTPLDASLKANKPPTETALQEAIDTGKAFLEKWGACEAWAQQAKFVTANVTRFEKAKTAVSGLKLFDRFDAAVNADNTAEIYAAGKEILAKQPDNHNIKYVMAVSVNREITKKNNAFNADAVTYAKALLDGLKSGAIKPNRKDKQGRDTIGVLKYEVPPQDAISELTYTLGNVLYFGQNDKKSAIPYFYQTTQTNGFRKEFAPIYATIGAHYIDEAAPLGKEIADMITKLRATTVEEEKVKLDAEIKQKEALFNGYTERAMDAFARAAKFAKADTPAGATYKKSLEDEVKRLYNIRFGKATGVEQWVASTTAKPLPDPTSPVQPVTDPEPTNTTTTTTGAGTGVGAANGTGAGNAAAAKTATAKPAKP